jgi:uncharacterized YkwD family protein
MKKFIKLVALIIAVCILTASVCFAQGWTYTVKSGDTLSKIANTNGVTVSDIMAANPSIKNSGVIYVGQKITIPSSKFVTYTVQKGDTMSGIAYRYEITLTELLKANPSITNPASIYVGQKILIPDTNSLSSYEQQVFMQVNKERTSRGLSPLVWDSTLGYVARLKSQDMINEHYFSHQSPKYGSPFQMMEYFGLKFSAAGENIAYGQSTAQEVMTAWMNSAGHRANILSSSYTHIGVGVAKAANGTLYWTQEFTHPY